MINLWKEERLAKLNHEAAQLGERIEQTAQAMAESLDDDQTPGIHQENLMNLMLELGHLAERIETNIAPIGDCPERTQQLTRMALQYVRTLRQGRFGTAYSQALVWISLAIAPYTD